MAFLKSKNQLILMGCAIMGLSLIGCSDDNDGNDGGSMIPDDNIHVGKAVGNFSADEWYPGGRLGTTENVTAGCYEDEAPAVTEQGLTDEFNHGEMLFERTYSPNGSPFNGLGPASVRTSCIDCHPGYGHGKRQTSYKAGFGNGYLLVIYHPEDGANSNDGPYISEVTGMPQTQASFPFLPPINEDRISLEWKTVTAMESGLPLQFPDGEKYELIYPEVYIPATAAAFNTDPVPTNLAFRLESTIGIIGTGMLDAIPQDSIRKQYEQTAAYAASMAAQTGKPVSEYINPGFWNASGNDFAAGAWYSLADGTWADGSKAEGVRMVKRFTYAMTRASLQDGPGANAIWNITNVSRSDRPYLYTTAAWATAMSKNKSVIEKIKQDPTSPYYADGTDEGIGNAVKYLLDPGTNQFENEMYRFSPDMSDKNYYDFLVWHRGLSIPRARNLNNSDVQRGKKLFMEMGCASCHRPSWTTADDNYYAPASINGKPLPRYPNQKIYPYTDMLQHKLYMVNDIHGSWCRTTPLWGRGLSAVNTGAQDRMHDCRARNETEAIMWHAYSKDSHAYKSAENFYNLPKADRDAVVKFLKSI